MVYATFCGKVCGRNGSGYLFRDSSCFCLTEIMQLVMDNKKIGSTEQSFFLPSFFRSRTQLRTDLVYPQESGMCVLNIPFFMIEHACLDNVAHLELICFLTRAGSSPTSWQISYKKLYNALKKFSGVKMWVYIEITVGSEVFAQITYASILGEHMLSV